MNMRVTRSRGAQSGYSLAEIIVVVAIIGMFSLIAIPAIMNYARASTIRGASWQFMTDVRRARTLAITESTPVTVNVQVGGGRYFSSGTTERNFDRRLDRTVVFRSTAFDDNQITFLPNGTIQNFPVDPDVTPVVVMKSEFKIPNNVVTFTFTRAGSVKSSRTTEE